MKPLALALLVLASCSNPSEPTAKVTPPPSGAVSFDDTTEATQALTGSWLAVENAPHMLIERGTFTTYFQYDRDTASKPYGHFPAKSLTLNFDGSEVWIEAAPARQLGQCITFKGVYMTDSIPGMYLVYQWVENGYYRDERYPPLHLTFYRK